MRTSTGNRTAIGATALLAVCLAAPARAQKLEDLAPLNEKSSQAIEAGDFASAARYAQEALDLGEKVLPANDPRLAVLATNAGLLLARTESWDPASAAYTKAVAITEQADGKDSPRLLELLQQLALCQARGRRFAEAFVTGERVLDLTREKHGDGSPEVADASAGLAVVALQDKHPKRADRLLRTALSIYRETKGEQAIEVARTYLGLGFVQFQLQQPASGSDYLRKAGKVFENVPDGHPEKLAMLEQRVQLLKNLGQPEDPEVLEQLERNRLAAPAFKAQQSDGKPGVGAN